MPPAIAELVSARGVEGFDVTPDGDPVYAAHRDGSADLFLGDQRLTDTERGLRHPVWIAERESAVAMRLPPEGDGVVRGDVVEVESDGTVRPVFEEPGMCFPPRPSPADSDRIGLVHRGPEGQRLLSVSLDTGETEPLVDTDDLVIEFAWSPDGEAVVYEAGMPYAETGLTVATLDGETRTLADFEGSSESLGGTEPGVVRPGARLWGPEGILFSSTASGYADVGVVGPDGAEDPDDVEWVVRNEYDAVPAGWSPDGETVAYLEKHPGGTHLKRWRDGDVETVADGGVTRLVRWGRSDPSGPVALRSAADSAGDCWRGEDRIVTEGRFEGRVIDPEVVEYESADGESIPALLFDEGEGGVSGPALVYAHGGIGTRVTEALEHNWLQQSLALHGYTVLAPNYRGSSGHGEAFERAAEGEKGVVDLRDVVAGASFLRERGADAVGIYGESWGGYLTSLALGTGDAFDAGVAISSITDLHLASEAWPPGMGARLFGGSPEENPDRYTERSPVTHAAEVDVPVLVAHGEQDEGVPIEHSERLVEELEDAGVDHEFQRFADAGHMIEDPDDRAALVERSLAFFDTHLD